MFKNLLGSRIKTLRKNMGMNQAELAEASGVEINTISRYETGANAPSIEQLLHLARALGVSPLELLPPQDAHLQQLVVLRQNLAEKAMQVDATETLVEMIQLADQFIATKNESKNKP